MMSTSVTASDWENKVMESKSLVAVEFWAPWCPWCNKLKPVFDEVAKEYDDRIKFADVNVDDNQDIAKELGVKSIPVIKFFCDGKEVGELMGYMPKDQLKKEMDETLENHKQCLSQSSSLKKD